jgi:hypothetical protein
MTQIPQKPEFDKIHPNKYYQHSFYNPDLNMFLTFSSDGMEKAIDNQENNIINAIPGVSDFPSFYHVHKPVFQSIDMSYFFGSLPVGRSFLPEHECSMGFSFKNTNPDAYYDCVILPLEDLLLKQKTGLLFSENGDIVVQTDLVERMNHVMDLIHKGKEEPQGPFVLKLQSLAP